MAESNPGPVPPDMEPTPRRTVALIWVFPLIAVIIALALLWRDYAERGPMIEISFPTAAGLSVGETALRYKNVEVGRLEDLRFSDDLTRVITLFRIDPDIARYIDSEAEFWVVRPEVSSRGVSGLETVISGVYVEGAWDAAPGVAQRVFIGLNDPPLTPSDTPGKRVRLRSPDGGALSVGAPIFFRRVEVGRVESKRLTPDGEGVEFDVFINAPNDARLTEGTRFWVVSGVDISFGADGAQFRIGSLSSLLQGGAAFRDFSDGTAEPVEAGHVYTLYDTPRDARSEVMETDPGEQLLLDVYFGRSVRGLSTGAPVEHEGIRVGRVSGIAAQIDADAGTFSTRTTVAIAPSLLGLEEGDVAGALRFMERAVADGLRAQLTQGSLLTGELIVRLVDAPDSPPATLRRGDEGRPLLPAVPSDLDEITGSVQGVLRRVDQLPIEAIFDNAVILLENINTLIASDGVRAAPKSMVAALDAATALLASPGLAAAPDEAAALLARLNALLESDEVASARADLAAALASLRAVAETLDASDLAGESAAAAAALRARLEDPALAGLAGRLDEASAAAAALLSAPALQAAPERAVAALDALEALLSDPALRATPEALNAALASLGSLLDDPALRAAPAELTAGVASARALVQALEQENAAAELSGALRAARALFDDPALRRFSGEAAATAAALREILAAPGATELPASATAALTASAALLDRLREDDLAGTAAAALKSLDAATTAVRRATEGTPELIRRLSTLAARTDDILASVDVGSELNYETVAAIREIRDAARAISDLADLVERQPNALIIGK
ncbi:intermembrane transport protein PqiB [Pikeienuella sp. HZG-20]|uniref:PqiB family protein n=1 Tax=Paludibacillus litoralis TaxID=3133267 RepID=UPI0030EB41BA